MRKELVISSYDSLGNPYYSGGGAIAIHEVAKRLTTEFKVAVICGNYENAKEKFFDGVHYRYIGTKYFGPKIGQLFYHLALPLAVLSTKHDIWLENFTPPFSTGFLPLFTKKPVVGLIHMLSGEDMKRKFKLPFEKIEELGLKLYKNFIVLSKNNKDKIKKINKDANFLLTKNGVNKPTKLLSYEKRSKKHILFLGRIEINQKGLDTLIQAYSIVKNKIKLPLLIAGSGEQSEIEKLKKLVNDNNLQDKVILVGRIGGEEKDWCLKHACMVVIPSRYETFSITALEAISYNIPLICGDIPGMKWVSEKLSLKFKSGSTSDLSNKLDQLYGSLHSRIEMSELQKSQVDMFDWKRISLEYSKFLNSI